MSNGNGKFTGLGLHRKQRAFLKAIAADGTIKGAAEAAKVSRQAHYDWLATDPDYVDAFAEAKETAADRLEQEAVRRATDGWDEPVYQGGIQVGTKRKFSDVLLIFMLKGMRPEKYKDRQETDHKGGIGGLYDGDPLERFDREKILAAVSQPKPNGKSNGNGHANGNGNGSNGNGSHS